MDLLVLDINLKIIAVLDTFESLIWTERFRGYGEFEIYEKASSELASILKEDYYLVHPDSEQVMIIESKAIKFDVVNGDYMIFSGRSLESILDRRIVWEQTILTGNLQNGIKKLIDDNAISPTISERRLNRLVFELSTDISITNLNVEAQFTGKNLYECVNAICASVNIGFRIKLSDDQQHFIFKLYNGTDRTYQQSTLPYVIFSPSFDNLISTGYADSKKPLRNVTLVAGEGEGTDRKTIAVGTASDLDRREMYTDARDIQQTVDDVLLSDTEYYAQLTQRGKEDLSENVVEKSIEGKMDPNLMFKYGTDYFMGDLVQIVSHYEIESRAQITELIHSHSTSGIDVYPTFTIIE